MTAPGQLVALSVAPPGGYALWVVLNFTASVLFGLVVLDILRRFLPLRRGVIRKAVLVLVLGFTVIIPTYFGDPVNTLGILPFFFAAVFFCTGGPKMARLTLSLILFPLTLSVNALADNFNFLWDQAIPRALFWLVFWLLARRFVPVREYRLSQRMWLLLDLLALTPMMILISLTSLYSMSDFLGFEDDITPHISWTLGFVPFITLSCLSLLVAVLVLARHERLEREEALWQLRSQYYEALEENQKQVRRLRHDMANHLQTLSGLQDDAARAYLAQLLHTPAMTGGRRFCQNEVANTVLGVKQALWEELGIPAVIEVALPDTLPFAAIDLASLFANSLDNAIEENAKLPPAQRSLRLAARAAGGVFLLRAENPMQGPLQTSKERILTSKPDRENHGFGLWGIEEIATRYGGASQVQADGERFVLTVSLPLNP